MIQVTLDVPMPTRCYDCPFCYDYCSCIILGDGFFNSINSPAIDPGEERLCNCPLVEVKDIP